VSPAHITGFVAAGTLAFCTDVAVLKGLMHFGNLNPIHARPFAILVAMAVSWLINRTYTFSAPGRPSMTEFARFSAVGWTAAALNFVIFSAILVAAPSTSPIVAIVVSSGCALVFSYAGMRFGVFRGYSSTGTAEETVQQDPRSSPALNPVWLFSGFFLAWLACVILGRYPGFIHLDLAEIYAWSRLGFEPGFPKHPPMLPWIVHAIDLVLPVNWLVLVVLSVANVTLGAYLVYKIARLTVGRERAPLTLAFYMASAYVTWHGTKLNHNTALLTFWPATVWAFLLALRDPTIWRGVVLGLVAAAALYTKYNTALLLVALLPASLVSEHRNAFYRSAAPYVAVIVFAAAMAPHVLWEIQSSFQTTANGAFARAPIGNLPWKLIYENVVRTLPVLAVFALLYRWLGRENKRDGTQHIYEMAVIVFVPWVLTVAVTMAMGLRGSHSWTTPVFALLPLLLTAALHTPTARQMTTFRKGYFIALGVIPIVAAMVFMKAFTKGRTTATEPLPEISRAGAEIWHNTIGTPVAIAGGEHRFAVGASLAIADHPRVWSNFVPETPPALVERGGALLFCAEKAAHCRQEADKLIADRGGWMCPIEMRRTRFGIEGRKHTVRTYIVPPRSFVKSLSAEKKCHRATPKFGETFAQSCQATRPALERRPRGASEQSELCVSDTVAPRRGLEPLLPT
jgi:putative flippase GtrA